MTKHYDLLLSNGFVNVANPFELDTDTEVDYHKLFWVKDSYVICLYPDKLSELFTSFSAKTNKISYKFIGTIEELTKTIKLVDFIKELHND